MRRIKRRVAAPPPPITMSVALNEHTRAVALITLLWNIDKRVRVTTRRKSTAKKRAKTVKGSAQYTRASRFDNYIIKLLFCIADICITNFFFCIVDLISMIDTVVLALDYDTFTVTDPAAFIPSAHWLYQKNPVHGIISKQNPTKQDLAKGIYKPRLTLAHRIRRNRAREIALKIELSLPKLVFGNNFNELQQKDYSILITQLLDVLASMGIQTTKQALEDAPILSVHYAKNIALTDGSTPYHYIKKIKQANIGSMLDVNQTDYRNDGYSYKWHCNSYEVIFYDKIRDLEQAKKSSKRTIEKDSQIQIKFYDAFSKRGKFEVFRMEVRLNTRKKITSLFAKLRLHADLSFKSIFRPIFSKKILLHYLDELESKRPPLLDYKEQSDEALFASLAFHNPHISARKIIQLYGLKRLLQSMHIREIKKILGRSKMRSVERLLHDANEIRIPHVVRPFMGIREQITQFKIMKIKKGFIA